MAVVCEIDSIQHYHVIIYHYHYLHYHGSEKAMNLKGSG